MNVEVLINEPNEAYPIPIHIHTNALGIGVDDLTVLVPVTILLPSMGIAIRVGEGNNVEVEDVKEGRHAMGLFMGGIERQSMCKVQRRSGCNPLLDMSEPSQLSR
jgi:hypothetical protein